MKQSADVVIIGGGVIGCSIAYHLCRRGVNVVVLDQGGIGAQASSAASGMLAPLKPFAKQDDSYTALLLSSLALFPELVSELEEISGICIEYQQTGTLRAMKAKQIQRLEVWIATWKQAGFPMELLLGNEICECEPEFSPDVSVALYNPQDPQLNAAQLVYAYARAAEKLGATLYTHEEVTALNHHGAIIDGVRTAQGNNITCQHLVLATGAWASQCAEWLHLTLPVRPLRGQSISLQQPPRTIRHMVFGEGGYLAPKQDGMIIVGTARDEAGFNVQTTPSSIAHLYTIAKKLVPALGTRPIQHAWAGLLPVTPDARPILGTVPFWDNVTLACGYNGYGLLLSASTGDMIAEQIVTGHISKHLRPFLLERFTTIAQ